MGCILKCEKRNESSFNEASQIYYQNYESNIQDELNNPKEKINLFLFLSNVENGNYSVNLLLSDDVFQTSKLICKTEVIKCVKGSVAAFGVNVILDYYLCFTD